MWSLSEYYVRCVANVAVVQEARTASYHHTHTHSGVVSTLQLQTAHFTVGSGRIYCPHLEKKKKRKMKSGNPDEKLQALSYLECLGRETVRSGDLGAGFNKQPISCRRIRKIRKNTPAVLPPSCQTFCLFPAGHRGGEERSGAERRGLRRLLSQLLSEGC